VTQTEWKASASSTPQPSACDRKMMSIRYLLDSRRSDTSLEAEEVM